MANECVYFKSSKSIDEVFDIMSKNCPKYVGADNNSNVVFLQPWDNSMFEKLTVGCEAFNNDNKYTLHLFFLREKSTGWQIVSWILVALVLFIGWIAFGFFYSIFRCNILYRKFIIRLS